MKKLKAIGTFLFKYLLSPPLIVIGIIPIIAGSICGALYTAFKAGWNMVK